MLTELYCPFLTPPQPTHRAQIEKYKKGDFGRCPRVLCYGQPLLPLGLSDLPYQKAVKLYCPRCEDLYSPKSSRHGSIDGAYFGSTFAHMLFMVYPGMIPSKSVPGAGQGSGGQAGLGAGGLGAQSAAKVERVRPRIFGFQVHEHAKLLRWQERVRDQYVALLFFSWLFWGGGIMRGTACPDPRRCADKSQDWSSSNSMHN